MISHKCYSNPHVLMMRSKASKDSSRGFQVSSEISFLISVRKTLSTSGQSFDLTSKNFDMRSHDRDDEGAKMAGSEQNAWIQGQCLGLAPFYTHRPRCGFSTTPKGRKTNRKLQCWEVEIWSESYWRFFWWTVWNSETFKSSWVSWMAQELQIMNEFSWMMRLYCCRSTCME